MEAKNNESRVALIKEEINKQLHDPETVKSLLDTTFNGLEPAVMKRALLEGMIRGFQFKDFLEKNVYAIPYGGKYSLVTSIDYSRKIGARSGIVGVEAPVYKDELGKIISCSVTVLKRFADGTIGKFTAEPYFSEYTTGKNLWSSKPRTMIAKVAEMHALRKACPEELAQAYVEEELEKEKDPVAAPSIDLNALRDQLKSCKTQDELNRVWADIPGGAKPFLKETVEEVKAFILSETKDIV
jgi:hypothetical protein